MITEQQLSKLTYIELEQYEERAGIREADGKLKREVAEIMAFKEVIRQRRE